MGILQWYRDLAEQIDRGEKLMPKTVRRSWAAAMELDGPGESPELAAQNARLEAAAAHVEAEPSSTPEAEISAEAEAEAGPAEEPVAEAEIG